MASPRNLTRNERERCVMARVTRRKILHQKNFAISKYDGSWAAAEKDAAAWVKLTLASLPPIQTNEGRLSKANTSGEVGVYMARTEFRKKGQKHHNYYSWIARWPGCRFNGGLAWSWQRFGDDDAYVLAVLSRRLRTVDREAILERFHEIKGKPEYERILAQWHR